MKTRTSARTLLRLTAGAALLALGACVQQAARPSNAPKEPPPGPRAPREFRTVITNAPASLSAAALGQELRSAQATFALVFAPADSAWFEEVGRTAALTLSRSTRMEGGGIGFFGIKPEGDTTIMLNVPGSAGLLVHDALYRYEKDKYVDLLGVRAPAGTPARESVRALLNYIASDVMSTSAVVLAIQAPPGPMADSISTLLRPALFPASDCKQDNAQSPARSDLVIFYGPEVRFECLGIQPVGSASVMLRLGFPKPPGF